MAERKSCNSRELEFKAAVVDQTEKVPLILASASPRRRELLQAAGLNFTVVPAELDESQLLGEMPEAWVLRLASAKAASVSALYPGSLVLAADTMVVLDKRVFGKPATLPEARQMLCELSAGQTHRVLSGVCLRQNGILEQCWYSESQVTFRVLSATGIDNYFSLVFPLDKAGAYAIQEHGDLLVADLQGSYSNVIGLPIEEVLARLAQSGWTAS